MYSIKYSSFIMSKVWIILPVTKKLQEDTIFINVALGANIISDINKVPFENRLNTNPLFDIKPLTMFESADKGIISLYQGYNVC